MKRATVALLAATLIVALGEVAGGTDGTTTTTSTTVVQTTASVETPTTEVITTSTSAQGPGTTELPGYARRVAVGWGGRAEIGDLYATVAEPVEDPGAPSASPGRKVMIAEVTLENMTGATAAYSPQEFTAVDQAGSPLRVLGRNIPEAPHQR